MIMNRRFFLQSSIAVLAADAVAKPAREVIDVNFSLGKWPGRELPKLGPVELQAKGITHAITGTFEALLARDLTTVNAQLAEACAKSGGRLIPAGSVNPLLPSWRAEMKRCRDQLIFCWIGQQVTGHLFDGKLIKWHVVVDRPDGPVTPWPDCSSRVICIP